MVTTKNPYYKKIGRNVANHFFVFLNKNNMNLATLIFMENEREAIGRRILIAIRVMEGKTLEDIQKEIGCGKNSINSVKRRVKNIKDVDKVYKQLTEVYLNQFKKEYISGLSHKKYPNIFSKKKSFIKTSIEVIPD